MEKVFLKYRLYGLLTSILYMLNTFYHIFNFLPNVDAWIYPPSMI